MRELAILIPVLGRPQRVAPLLESIRQTTPGARILFVCSPGDDAEIKAIKREAGELIVFDGSYAAKVNEGIRRTEEPLLFTGADDLEFLPGWLEAARTWLDDRVEVVGVNDLIARARRPQHATHFLVTRRYAECRQIDGEPGLLSETYAHNCCDDELIATATRRGVYAFAPDAHVRHLHPMAGGADDETYRLGRGTLRADRRRWRARQALWS